MVFTSLGTYFDSSNVLLTFVSEGKICSKNELELLYIVKRSMNEFRKMSAEKILTKLCLNFSKGIIFNPEPVSHR